MVHVLLLEGRRGFLLGNMDEWKSWNSSPPPVLAFRRKPFLPTAAHGVRSWLTVRTTFPVFCPVSTFRHSTAIFCVAVGEHLGYLFTGAWTALVSVALIQSEVLHPLFGVMGLVLSPLFLLGSLEFVGAFERAGWRLAGALVPVGYIGWSLWLLAIGIGLLITA
jgi:hypothetical protein